jgi:hypothetical protein
LFHTLNDDPDTKEVNIEQALIDVGKDLCPHEGDSSARELINIINDLNGDPAHDLRAESRDMIANYCRYHFVHGGVAEKIITAIVQFIGTVAPEVDVRAWLVGDDDPWEVLFRFEAGKVICKEYEPTIEQRSEKTLPTEYKWWHKNMPLEISEGLINEWKSISDDVWEEEWGVQEESISLQKTGPCCPYCGGELRTPRAKQCPHCFKQWHNEISVHMDEDVILYFKKIEKETEIPFQRLINSYLKDCAVKQRRPNIAWSNE